MLTTTSVDRPGGLRVHVLRNLEEDEQTLASVKYGRVHANVKMI